MSLKSRLKQIYIILYLIQIFAFVAYLFWRWYENLPFSESTVTWLALGVAWLSLWGSSFMFEWFKHLDDDYTKKPEYLNKLAFFNLWLRGIGENNNEYCKIGAKYSEELKKMVPLESKKLAALELYNKVMKRPKKYKQLCNDWKNLKDITLDLNKELADLFEEIRLIVKTNIDLHYWCPEPQSDEPLDGYLCPNTFIRAIYDEVEYKQLNPKRRQFYGNGEVKSMIRFNNKIEWFFKWGNDYPLAVSSDKELMDNAQSLFSQFIEDEKYKEIIKTLSDKQKKIYDPALEKVKADIKSIIESMGGNTIPTIGIGTRNYY